MIKQRKVLSRRAVEEIGEFEKNVCVVSITDPGSEYADIKIHNGIKVQFADVDQFMVDRAAERGEVLPYKEISGSQAKFLAQCIIDARNDETIDSIVFHCEAGISRSAGLCVGFLDFFYGPQVTLGRIRNNPRHVPNALVDKKLLQKLRGIGHKDSFTRKD